MIVDAEDLKRLEEMASSGITYADWDRDMSALIATVRDRDAEAARLRAQLAEVRGQVDTMLVLHDQLETERDELRSIIAEHLPHQNARRSRGVGRVVPTDEET